MVERKALTAAAIVSALLALGACATAQEPPRQPGQSRLGDSSGIGGIGIPFLGGQRQSAATSANPEIGVNSFLWRAALDTLRFMPLQSEDPFGGVIVTDWYSDPAHPNERFKAQVYILDTRLRADGVNVSIFRQTRTAAGWQDAAVNPDTATQIEDAILRRARELRLSTIEEN